jgi:alkylation response protein AidB-like acyl-CoA dehydrogenase
MVMTAIGSAAARPPEMQDEATLLARARKLAPVIAGRAAAHDRDGSFAFENFQDLFDAGLLSLTVPQAHGGHGAGARTTSRVLSIIAQADASTALVLGMHYIQHFTIARHKEYPARLARKLARESVEAGALLNTLRVEPALGSPSRGGLPETTARRTETGWRLTGHKIYSTGSPILKWYAVWAKTDEAEPRLGLFLVPSGLPGTRIVETWDHLGLRASGSHDVIFDDVVIPLDYEIELRKPVDWRKPDPVQGVAHAVLLGAIYDGIARAARDWIVDFLKTRSPASLGAPLATLPRAQEVLGAIEARLQVNARLIDSVARDFDDGIVPTTTEANIVKLTVTNNAIAAVEDALSLSSNHGLSRANPLERHYRDVLCGRVHTPQDDATRVAAGRAALGL